LRLRWGGLMSSLIGEQPAVIVDPDRSTVELVRSLLLTARKLRTLGASDVMSAWNLLGQVEPKVIFVAHTPPLLNAPQLTRELRRSDLISRKVPVVMLAIDPTESQIMAARDAGVHEVLRKPFTLNDLLLRIDTVLNKNRDWVEGVGYVGPDRRRFNSAQFAGQRKRRHDKEAASPENARVGQALKIMKAAIEAIDSDPRQALRALRVQADELQEAAVAMADFALAGAAKTLKTYLDTAVERGCFSSQECAKELRGLLGGPSDIRKSA
jgi:DNA-binding response OmpR family regulator